MKKYYRFMLMAAVVCGVSFAVTSCKDDDNNNGGNGGGEQVEGLQDATQRFWNVAGHLCTPFDVTDDYADQTFEPTIGEPLEGNSTVRVVTAENMDVAAGMFNDITGAAVTASTDSYTFQDDAVGTLTYTKSTDGKSLATVDVNIKQIPHLQQIVFKTAEQMGDNAATATQPYYSFGDIISRPNKDGVREYWMCVHMTFTPQSTKNDSYWVTLNKLPKANIKTYKGSNGTTYNMPTALETSEACMQNLAEMLYAVMEPEEWEETAMKDTSPLPFGDVKRENVKYISKDFWERVCKAWNATSLDEKVFGTKWGNLAIKMQPQNGGLHLLYKGYSWWFTSSNKCSLYEYTFKSGGFNKQANGHNASPREVKKEMINSGMKLDCVNEYQADGWVNEQFFGDKQARYIFRFATGKQLYGSKPNIYTSMEGKKDIKDEYVYTQYYGVEPGADKKMPDSDIFAPLTEYEGAPHYHLYDVYEDEKGKKWFVVSMAGDPVEQAPVSELVSFDDCFSWSYQQTTDNTYTTSALMPSRDAAIRAFMLMWATETNNSQTTEEAFPKSDAATSVMLRNVIEHANVNLRRVFQHVLEVDGARANTETASIIYGPGTGEGQPMLRFVIESHNTDQIHKFHIYEHYPSQPNATSEYYTSFSNEKILLSDLKNQDKVTKYAKDFWAERPLTSVSGGDDQTPRARVTTTNRQATSPVNFMYQSDLWNDFSYPTGMWNEPIIVIAFDAVVDRGPENYSTTTINGRRLKLVHAIPIEEDPLNAGPGDLNVDLMRLELTRLYNSMPDPLSLDGQDFQLPTWRTVWATGGK
jgi:hypothetical protein